MTEVRIRGEEYLLERSLFRSGTTGEVIDETWLTFSFPYWWHYDILRGLEYMTSVGRSYDDRIDEALEIVAGRADEEGRWPVGHVYPGEMHFDIEGPAGLPSKWNTLRALRVSRRAGREWSSSQLG